MRLWSYVIIVGLSGIVACRVKQTGQDSNDGIDSIISAERVSLVPPSFSSVANPIPFTVAAMPESCNAIGGPMRSPSDDFGGWSPANGNLVVEAPVGYGLSFYYHTTVPYQPVLQSSGVETSKTSETDSNQSYTWQSNFDAELSPLIGGPAGAFSLRGGNGQEVRFGADGVALDGSGSYVRVMSATERRVYHRDEDGSYDSYEAVPYQVQSFSPFIPLYPAVCVTVPTQTVNKCKTSVALRYLYARSGRTTDGVTTTRVVRNGVGRVTNVYNAANVEVLRIRYAGTAGNLATLPVSVMGAPEISGGAASRVNLQWNGKGFPLLSKITFKNDLNQDVVISYNYQEPFSGPSPGVRGMIASVVTSGDGPGVTTSFELAPATGAVRPQIRPGSILKVTTGTFGTKFAYERDSNSPSFYHRVRISRWVKQPHDDAKVNSSEILYMDRNNACKLVQYNDGMDDYVRFKRNPDDPNRVDAIGTKEGKLNTAVAVARRGGADINRKFDVQGIFSTDLSGLNIPRLEVEYIVHPVSGAILEEIPLGERDFRTTFEYDDSSLKPENGVRLVKVRNFNKGVETSWAGRSFDGNKRLEVVTIDDHERARFAYDSIVNNNQPLQVTISDPSKPINRPVKIEVNSYGDVKEYLDQSGLAFKQEIDSMLRLREVQGYGVSTFNYDPQKPWRVSSINSDGQELLIEQPTALQSRLKFKTNANATFQSTRESEAQPNGLPKYSGGDGLRFFSDPTYESQY